MSPEIDRGVTVSPLAIVLAAAVVLIGICILAWSAGKQYRDLQATLKDTRSIIEAQSIEINAMREGLERMGSDLKEIRVVAAQAKTKIIEYRTEVAHASDAVDALPAPDVQPRLRAVADAYIAEHAQPVPAHQ